MLRFQDHDHLRSLRVRDVDLQAGVLRCAEDYGWKPKASSGTIPLHDGLRVMLRRLAKQRRSEFVFPDPDGGPWRFHLDRHLDAISKMAKLKKPCPRVHDLRHTVGFALRRAGVALETIKALLRHASIEETLRYARYDIEEGRKAMEQLPSPVRERP